jgi:CheY-like chemotaxis protein
MEPIIKNILLVDDSSNDVTLIKAALQKLHFDNKIIVAEDGEEAIDFLYKKGIFTEIQDNSLAFILLDIKMPLLNGLEVLKIIRNDAAFNKIPIVMLTSSRNINDIQECYNLGANSYVVKPINYDEFIKVVVDIGNYWCTINEKPM